MLKITGREAQVQKLEAFYGVEKEHPSMIFVYGNQSTGKTFVLSKFFQRFKDQTVHINCLEHVTVKTLLEAIINRSGWWNSAENYIKIESNYIFLEYLLQLDTETPYILVLDNAEVLRDLDPFLIKFFGNLQLLSGLNISVVLVSQIVFEKFHAKCGDVELSKVYFEDYSKDTIALILGEEYEKHLQAVNATRDVIDKETHESYIELVLSVVYKACRDLTELKFITKKFFRAYCEPILNGTISRNETSKLWRNISKVLKDGVSQLYMRTVSAEVVATQPAVFGVTEHVVKKIVDLPFYSKYLLIAGFLASHNALKNDKRLFLKNHGKKMKRVHHSNFKTFEKMATSLGPQSFTIDRLLAIFCSVLEEKVGVTCNLISQIATLVHLKYFSFVSGENNAMDGTARLQANISQETVIDISRSVGFEIKSYLTV